MSNYTQLSFPNQLLNPEPLPKHFTAQPGMISFFSHLPGFVQTGEPIETEREFNSQKKDQASPKLKKIVIPSAVYRADDDGKYLVCPECGAYLRKDGFNHSSVFHLPQGLTRVELNLRSNQIWSYTVFAPSDFMSKMHEEA